MNKNDTSLNEEKIYNQLVDLCSLGSLNDMKKIINNIDLPQYINDILLVTSSIHGHLNVAQYLIQNGADIKSQNFQAIISASHHGHLELLEYYKNIGVNLNFKDNLLFKEAAEYGNIKVLKYFIDSGVNVQISNNYALKFACKNSHFEAVKLLIEHGADIYDDKNVYEKNIFDKFLTMIFKQKLSEKHLIKKNAIQICMLSTLPESKIEVIKYLYDLYKDKDFIKPLIIDKGNEDLIRWVEIKELASKLDEKLDKTNVNKKRNKI